MASIDDFVNHRWQDAKEELRKLDSDFVTRLESEHRLQRLGLGMPLQYSVGDKPKQQLPTKWHRLLESCLELTMQARNVQVASTCLTAKANSGLSSYEAGMRADYNFRSWFIHATALTERTDDVINKTTEVYITEPERRTNVARCHRTSVFQKIREQIKQQRESYVHGAVRSWASSITEDQLWEGEIAIGMTPTKSLDEFWHPTRGEETKDGKYDGFVAETMNTLDCVGTILQELEADLIVNCGITAERGRTWN